VERFESPWRLLWYRLQAPARCWRALARDYGDFAVFLITLANIAVVLKETGRRLVAGACAGLLGEATVRDGAPIRLHPAASLLEALE
jgi:hypothetical protein